MLRTLRIASLTLLVSVASAIAQTIPASQAQKHIGEQATVCGIITDEFEAQSHLSKDSAKFIYLDRTEAFSVLTWFQDKAKLGNVPDSGSLCVKDRIHQYLPEDLIVFEPYPKVGICSYGDNQRHLVQPYWVNIFSLQTGLRKGECAQAQICQTMVAGLH